MPASEYQQLKAAQTTLEGTSEYDVLGKYGKPTDISMNNRSEKVFRYHPCGDSTRTIFVRFGATGRVRETWADEPQP